MTTVTILHDPCPITLPSDDEYRRLARVVLRHFPKLGPRLDDPTNIDEDEVEFLQHFRLAFYRLAHMRRTEEPSRRHALSYWITESNAWYRDKGQAIDIRGDSFLCAVLGAGDIAYSPANLARGFVWEIGLSDVGVGRPAVEAWKTVLSTGELRKPSPPPRHLQRSVEATPVQVFGADGAILPSPWR